MYSRISTSDTTYNNKVAALASLDINRDSLLQLSGDNAIMNIRSDVALFVFNTVFKSTVFFINNYKWLNRFFLH